MRQRVLSFIVLLSIFCSFGAVVNPMSVAAVSVRTDLERSLTNSGNEAGFNSGTKLPAIVGWVIRAFLGLLGVVFIIMIIYAGFEWIQAQGEDSKITEARKMIIHSTIGLIIVMAAYSITVFVLKALQTATGTLNSP